VETPKDEASCLAETRRTLCKKATAEIHGGPCLVAKALDCGFHKVAGIC